MDRKDDGTKHADFANVEKYKHELIPEEFPDGPLGSAFNDEKPVTGKSKPWIEGQYHNSAFVYENKDLHDDLPRQTPGSHPLHDDDDEKKQ